MSKSSALIFILLFSVILKLEKPVSSLVMWYDITCADRCGGQHFVYQFSYSYCTYPPHTHTSQCMVVMLESNDGRGGTFHSGGAVHVHLPFNQVFCGRIFVGK